MFFPTSEVLLAGKNIAEAYYLKMFHYLVIYSASYIFLVIMMQVDW